MNKKFCSRVLLLLIGLVMNLVAGAQDTTVEMADGMRSNGKIYIVVAVCLTILIGLFLYMTMLDRKMSRMEKNRNAE